METTSASPPPSPSSGRFKLYDQLELLEFQDKYVINLSSPPIEASQSDAATAISTYLPVTESSLKNFRFELGELIVSLLLVSDGVSVGTPSKTSVIYGVAGTIRLIAGTYMLVITSRKRVGDYLGFPVFRVTSMKFLPCNESLKLSTWQEKKDEGYFVNLLKTVESTPGLYYSYQTDVTLNLQRRCNLTDRWKTKPLGKQADPRFVWNKNLLDDLIEFKLDEFIVPLMQGSFGATQLKLKESPATISLVSRRCNRRLGTRMWRRGANLEGDTANFIETEQLLEIEGYRSSLLQIRGSIPLLWEQIVDLSYKPRLRIINNGQTPKVVERHFHDLLQRYGDTIALDLTNKHGDEGQLNSAYAAEVQKLPSVRYASFDFHHVCSSTKFDRLHVLYDLVSEEFEKQGVPAEQIYTVDVEGNLLEEQKGIIRSNCIDCLDRTNVTQSYLAQKSLTIQLQRIGIFTPTECLPMFIEDYGKFRTLWAEQGDEISLEYAGTHALKGDLVRYGRQTMGGIIKDGVSALSRYCLNNFQDGLRQDAMDLISGHYSVKRNGPSQFQLREFESSSYLPVASALLIGGLTITFFTVHQASQNAHQYLSTVFLASVTAGVMAVVKANGRQFCSRPRLCGLI